METNADRTIRNAITHRRLIRFSLHGRHRIAEPHDYGIRKGKCQLLVYQVAGESASGPLPNWRWVEVDKMSDLETLEQTFSGSRGVSATKHSDWDELFLRVRSKDQEEPS